MSESFELDVLLGVANLAADNPEARVALWAELGVDGTPNPAKPGAIGIYVDRKPEGLDCVVLSDYGVSDDPSLSDSVIGVQAAIWTRDFTNAKTIASDLFSLLHGRHGGTLGLVTLVNAMRTSGTGVGQDSSERQGRTENYYLTVHRPSANRQ